MASDPSLHKRLLRDIAELQSEPYPYIEFHVQDSLERACLILIPEGSAPLHLTMLLEDYPLKAPNVTIQSYVRHPNVFGDYICASILNTQEGYTPAYTLKSIAIQLLSFFSSDSLEQSYGGIVNLTNYKATRSYPWSPEGKKGVHCDACGFDSRPKRITRQVIKNQRQVKVQKDVAAVQQKKVVKGHLFVMADKRRRTSVAAPQPVEAFTTNELIESLEIPSADATAAPSELSRVESLIEPPESPHSDTQTERSIQFTLQDGALGVRTLGVDRATHQNLESRTSLANGILDLPDEILLIIFASLSFLDLISAAKAFPRAREILDCYDLIRMRELQCFCLKEHFQQVKLGVGVHVGLRGKEGKLSSEFDPLSHQAFHQHCIRTSIQGLPFEYWLPLPYSRRHFQTVKLDILQALDKLASAGRFADVSHFSVVSHFLNDIVVSFSEEAERSHSDPCSTLTHASEKAVESYFAIYHLLLCLAADNPIMIRKANAKVSQFLSGKTSKTTCPSLGHLLVATLISDQGLTEELSVAIINEAVLRNVVWMLDSKGANMPELSYLEPSAVSEYRLQKTFKASLTSYRLLMFCHLFCRTARGPMTEKPLTQLRDELFDTHGAPARGVAQCMAEEIRRIKSIDSFPPFMKAMGIQERNMPGKAEFTGFLREMVHQSAVVGYSRMPFGQLAAFGLRILKEPDVEMAPGLRVAENWQLERAMARLSFFPNRLPVKDRRDGD
ncbi:MAG: hypothetical protein Q9209_006441 [Squamulea sp. 1 TL-2023]